MELQIQLLLYLDKNRILFDMKSHCENFISNSTSETLCKFPPFRYNLEIDVMTLLDFLPELGRSLLTEPLKWQRTCDKILYAILRSFENDFLDTIQTNQVAVVIRLKNISPHMTESGPGVYKSLDCFKGKLLNVSKPFPYVYHTVWSCPEECDSNEVIIRGIPKTPTRCSVCRSILFENSVLRRCGEQITATFKMKNVVMPKKLEIVDDLLLKAKLGLNYLITIVVQKNITEVWSIEVLEPLLLPITAFTSCDIQELFDVCDGVPWKFIYCLASTIGATLCPLNCFMHLKITLLLSLTSIKANVFNVSNIIHVLATGFDTRFVGKLMYAGAALANTSMALGTSNTSITSSLIACTGGILFMPLPLHTYHKKLTGAILSSIESNEIIHDTGRIKLGCAVWAQGMDFKNVNVNDIAKVFGTVCRGDYGEYEDDIAEYMLLKAIDPNHNRNDEKQAMTDVAQYIDLVASIPVKLDCVSEKKLTNYFLAARKERPRGVPIGSLETLLNICMNSARLCRRFVTNEQDAIFAIWLHVSACFEPRFAPDEYLQTPADVKQLHKIFDNFKNWLNEFTGSYDY
ncbi:unnamed protein product [Diatraea saccharalis]|uniref:MCMDC2 N-terminal domain-containing protein n=1 Tax=Diatraea saccharalis TaxID=40085 RepID=A0A9N9R2Q6_9NEOP|nr:unnamed protein product [Diatraea saccharalis]